MKCIKKKTIEEVIEAENLRITGLKLQDKELSLNVYNIGEGRKIDLHFNSFNKKDERSEAEYKLSIDENGIRFERRVYRPNDSDIESLQIVTKPKKIKTKRFKKGELVWRSKLPHEEEGYEYFYVPFGNVRLNY